MVKYQIKEIYLREVNDNGVDYTSSCVVRFIGPPWDFYGVVELLSGKVANGKRILDEASAICKLIGATRIEWERANGKKIVKKLNEK